MKIQRLYAEFAIFSVAVVVLFVVGSASVSSDPFLGISPQDEKFYKLSEIIQCKNGSKKFTRAQLNDDFCDCPDGTDEPGTSACPEGKFFCRNAGHLPISLFSSRVNDGICDCCDGSDEYGGKVKCPNTCWEAGKVARDKLKKNIAMYQKGVAKRGQEVEQAKQAISKDEAELSKLKKEEKMLTGIVNKLRERKEQIEKMEEKERLKKEKEEKMKADAKEKADKENPEADDKAEEEKETMETPQDNEIETLEEPALDQNEKDEFHNTEELSREELGRIVASRWTGESTGHQAKEMDAATTDAEADNETPESTHDEDFNKYASDIEEEGPTHGEDGTEDNMDESIVEDDHDGSIASHTPNLIGQKDSSDMTIVSNPSWLDKIWKIVENIFKPVISFQTPVDISDAARVREEYYDSSTKLSDIQSRISSLTEKLKHDCGVEKEFYLFHDRCFEMKQNKYLYKVCPFKDASQEEGHSRTQLGYWEKFENAHSIMLFSNGNTCWNGPDRSLKVKLTCGLKTELTDVDEPSRCEYVGLMSTPLLCLEGKLKELEHRLELMNKEQPQSHDEL